MAGLLDFLWVAPALPLAGFLILALVGRRLPRWAVGAVGAGSVGLAAVLCAFIAWAFVTSMPPDGAFSLTLWSWIHLEGFNPQISLYLDRLSVVMMLVITGVGFMIHLYSTEYMLGDEGYSRFFAYLNLFVAFMLVLVLAGDLLLLFLGWEGVGLCSYLLIGFWYRDPENGLAAQKSFIVTRIGDAAFLLGLLLLFTVLGSENIQEILQRAATDWPAGSLLPTLAAFLILGGAVGKSAQLPLQVWLPDAMAGPTPVSALIHAATMVTAGVYLIGRTEVLFAMAPLAQTLVGIIAAATILISGFAALGQRDIKRILAYSTISQIGYMVLLLQQGPGPRCRLELPAPHRHLALGGRRGRRLPHRPVQLPGRRCSLLRRAAHGANGQLRGPHGDPPGHPVASLARGRRDPDPRISRALEPARPSCRLHAPDPGGGCRRGHRDRHYRRLFPLLPSEGPGGALAHLRRLPRRSRLRLRL
ncbi:MAG: NADH-quinone oxidoreductase subunit L [Chromatiaceae bacterium]